MSTMKKHKPKNLGVIVLFIILTFSTCFIVNAKTATKKTETKKEETTDKEVEKKVCDTEKSLLKKYNVKFDKSGDTYTLSINPDRTDLKNVVFKVVKIGKQSVTDKNLTVKKRFSSKQH